MNPQDLRKALHIPDRELHEIYVRLGEVSLVPFTDSNNMPPSPKTFAETQKAEYLRRLAESHVAVALGPASGALYAVSFETASVASAFVDANPVARKTAVLDRFDARTFFFRIEGFAPGHVAWDGGEWVGSGNCVPVRIKAVDRRLTWRTDYTPARIKFDDLVWSKGVQSLFTPQFVGYQYGRPFYPGRKGTELNYAFWAYYYASENRVRFLPERGDFYHLDSGGSTAWRSLPLSELETDLLDWLLGQGRKPEFEFLQRPLDAAARRKLIGELKVVALGHLPGLTEGLKQFITECLEKWPGGTISVRELYVVYCQFCRTKNLPILPEGRFQRMSPELIQLHYQCERSNSIPRPTGPVRGYRGIRPKLTVIEGGPEADGKSEEGSSANGATENRKQNG